MTEWVDDAVRRYWLAWLQDHIDRSVVDLFGYHAVQIGEPDLDGLRANRMPYRWNIDPAGQLDAVAEALPFKDRSLDLVLLPHTLERSVDPHQALREVERVLVPEGGVVIAGLNPFSAWSLRQSRYDLGVRLGVKAGASVPPFGASAGQWLGLWRLRDWLKLLGFEVELVERGLFRPACATQKWLDRCAWMDAAGHALWPWAANAYLLVAVKRVRGAKLMSAAWKQQRRLVKVPAKSSARVGSTSQKDSLNKSNATPHE